MAMSYRMRGLLGGRPRLYKLNESAFDDARNCHDAAYWAGFLMADGCITDGNGVRLSICETDGAHLFLLRDFLASDAPIHVDGHRGYPGSKPKHYIQFNSKRIIESLGRYGVVAGKTKRAKVVGLEDNPHFWRGVVDGDGSVGWGKTKKLRIPMLQVGGSCSLMKQMVAFIRAVAPGCKATVGRHSPSSPVYTARTGGRFAKRVLQALYVEGAPALARKAEAARECIAWEFKSGRDWSFLNRETVEHLFNVQGSWKATACVLGVTTVELCQLRHQLGMLRS